MLLKLELHFFNWGSFLCGGGFCSSCGLSCLRCCRVIWGSAIWVVIASTVGDGASQLKFNWLEERLRLILGLTIP